MVRACYVWEAAVGWRVRFWSWRWGCGEEAGTESEGQS